MTVKEIKAIKPPYPFEAYAHVVSPLSAEDGGGYLITFPDLPGCMSDGETPEEAIENGKDSFLCWVSAQADMGRPIPKPTCYRPEEVSNMPGKFVQRIPKSLHAKLAERAKQEGVSINTLVLAYIAQGMGGRGKKARA